MLEAKWLELLNANGLKLAAVSIACAILLWGGLTSPLPDWAVQLIVVAMVVSGLLALASAANPMQNLCTAATKWLKERRALTHAIDTLNSDETEFLKEQVRSGHNTVQLNPFNAGNIRHFVHQAGLFQGLQNKGIVSVTAADPEGKVQTVIIETAAWRILKKKFAETN